MQVEEYPLMNKKQINLIFLICGALVIPVLGYSINDYSIKAYNCIDNCIEIYIDLAISIGMVTSVFVIIKKSIKVVFGGTEVRRL